MPLSLIQWYSLCLTLTESGTSKNIQVTPSWDKFRQWYREGAHPFSEFYYLRISRRKLIRKLSLFMVEKFLSVNVYTKSVKTTKHNKLIMEVVKMSNGELFHKMTTFHIKIKGCIFRRKSFLNGNWTKLTEKSLDHYATNTSYKMTPLTQPTTSHKNW